MYINSITLAGQLGKTPEIKEHPNGSTSLHFTLYLQEYNAGRTFKTILPIECYGKVVHTFQNCKRADWVSLTGKVVWRKQTKQFAILALVGWRGKGADTIEDDVTQGFEQDAALAPAAVACPDGEIPF